MDKNPGWENLFIMLLSFKGSRVICHSLAFKASLGRESSCVKNGLGLCDSTAFNFRAAAFEYSTVGLAGSTASAAADARTQQWLPVSTA